MDAAGDYGIVQAAQLKKSALLRIGLPVRHDHVQFPARQPAALLVSRDLREQLDFADVAVAEGAEQLVGGAVGKDDDVAGVSAAGG